MKIELPDEAAMTDSNSLGTERRPPDSNVNMHANAQQPDLY